MAKNAPIKDVLKQVISKIEERKNEEENLHKAWKQAAGKSAAKHTRLVLLKSKRLIVNVSNSPWLYKLTMEKGELIQKFNKNMAGKKKIEEIQFRIGDI